MQREDFWIVVLIVLAAALLWIVVHVFWGHNEHRRNIDLGINALLLIPVVIGVVMLTRWIRGRPVFTERDWLFLFGHPREKVSLASPVAEIRGVMVRRCGHRLC